MHLHHLHPHHLVYHLASVASCYWRLLFWHLLHPGRHYMECHR